MICGYESEFEQYDDYMSVISIYLTEYLDYMQNRSCADSVMDKYKGIAVSAQQAYEFCGVFPFNLSQRGEIQCKDILNKIKERSLKSEIFLPFDYLCKTFSIGKDESLIVMACFLEYLYPQLKKTYAYINDNVNLPFLTAQSADKIFLNANVKRMYDGLNGYMPMIFDIEENEAANIISLKLNKRILALLLDSKLIYPLAYSESFAVTDKLEPMYGRKEEEKLILNAAQEKLNIFICIEGEKGEGKKFFVKHICRKIRKNVIFVDVSKAQLQHEDKTIWELEREIRLQRAACCLINADDKNLDYAEKIIQKLLTFSQITFMCSEKQLRFQRVNPVRLKLNQLSYEENLKIWKSCTIAIEDKAAEKAASYYNFSPGQIKEKIEKCNILCKMKRENVISYKLIEQVCLECSRDILKDKAVRINTKFAFDDLILPWEEKQLLKEGIDHIRYKSKVYENWDFSSKLGYSKGLSMLFEGPPGTGKTMAASIVGNELGLSVFKVDISKLMSKYVGETEKNLGEIFNTAQKNNAVLFFDEMDSIFSKRCEIKDSHDKYANVQTSYLLQKMDDYDGIIIMATNFKQNVDDAFLRRISYIIHFPFPETSERLKLWKSVFPQAAEVDKQTDFEFLAENFEMSGAMIKSTALSAAFLAAAHEDDQIIRMRDILKAVKKQFSKLGKNFSPDDFGEYASLMEQRDGDKYAKIGDDKE